MELNDQMMAWNTDVVESFNKLNFDKLLTPNLIEGLETFITYNKKHLEGYEIKKQHIDKPTRTRYFIKSSQINELPLIVLESIKIHDKGNVYHLVTRYKSFKIVPAQVLSWRELIDSTGIPKHTNMLHYTLYKNKVLYGRLNRHLFTRIVTESAFGKDKYIEGWMHLINNATNVSDPSAPKLFYSLVHTRDVTINELPDTSNKSNFIKFCNMIIRASDGSNRVDNPSRATAGTKEFADTSLTSLRFLHNVPSYYHSVGEPSFDDIYPKNVVNRLYYNLYTGYLQAEFPNSFDIVKEAEKYSDYYKKIIKTALWYQENWHSLGNRYSNVDLSTYYFDKKNNRYRDHFIDFAKCLSHYARDEQEYKMLLDEEYKTHKDYEKLLAKERNPSEFDKYEVKEEYVGK